jgi:2-keto-4-pentenoate hydratase/2-oxohepta-3-ene-1,7-dioic acid hydratase in catechol pathway
MRLCRYQDAGRVNVGLYDEARVVGLHRLADALGESLPQPDSANLLDYLPPEGELFESARTLAGRYEQLEPAEQERVATPLAEVKLLVPIPQPRKVILLAGNYAEHIREGGGQAAERQKTFPYFFWKPPSTTLTHPGDPIRIPRSSPDHIDWEIELGVIIGRRCRDVAEEEARHHVAGYSICNDISDRKYIINADRQKRDRDAFFDWLHGKWHDTFLPMGPCVLPAGPAVDPQTFPLQLRVNGQVMQDASTSQMIFPVAALVSILSGFVTLEPGDIISTGTPAGVGNARTPPVYLKPGDSVEAAIAGIGVLRNPVV